MSGTEAPTSTDKQQEPLPDGFRTDRPAPGTEFPYSVSDVAHTAAMLLGRRHRRDGRWAAQSGGWGTTGCVRSPGGDLFPVEVGESNCCLRVWLDDAYEDLRDVSPSDDLVTVAAAVVAAIRTLLDTAAEPAAEDGGAA